MAEIDPILASSVERIIREVGKRRASYRRPFLIAIDGGSGSGKSTIAARVAAELKAALVPGDDFFAAAITEEGWNQRTPQERAADCIDWPRLRKEVLEPLLNRQSARWQAFDFVSGVRSDGTYGMLPTFSELHPADVLVLDGAYSAGSELADIIDFAVLVDVPIAVRHARLRSREEKAFLDAWHARWDCAEEYYFTHLCPPARFDLIIANAPRDQP